MLWVKVFLFFLIVASFLILDRFVKKKYDLPKKLKYTKRFNSDQVIVETGLLFIALVGILFASISRLENGIYRPLNPIPLGIWLFLFISVLYVYRGYMVKKYFQKNIMYILLLQFGSLLLDLFWNYYLNYDKKREAYS
ncbi:DUF4181 domain-containing protein [Psychrobacillus sp. FSL H8-0484]|uniref:DUF4181 domain-containing protein n=1 Tax=Psychrobacillus sp. FSL H8-0484 TaxID=2921390 RepID=UPI0030FA433C